MKVTFRLTLLCVLFIAPAVLADDWSLGAGTGPFVFGKFVSRTSRITTDTAVSTTTLRLSAATRPGLVVDVERSFSERWAARLEGTFTESKLSVRGSGSGVHLDAGRLNVTSWALPLVFTINPHGSMTLQIFGGPAFAQYDIHATTNHSLQPFNGSRGRAGGMAGVDLQWWLRHSFAIEAKAQDIVTASPFERSDFPVNTTGLEIAKPHNVHTSLGIRWRF